MTIVVIGLGSMGRRRIRLIHKIKPDSILIGVDGKEDRQIEAERACEQMGFTLSVYSSVSEIPDSSSIDAAIVSTSPLSHGAIISECLRNGWHVFTEINLVADGYDENIKLAKDHGLTLYLSSTPMFRREISYITETVHEFHGRVNYCFHVGQYLPDWHPWEDYKNFFAGQKTTNGCREIMAIELPWMIRCFGEIDHVECINNRQTNLNIDYQDCYNILVKHDSGNTGVFVVDVVCRPPVRSLEVYGDGVYVSWDGRPDGVRCYDKKVGAMIPVDLYGEIEQQEGYNSMIIENAYEAELLDFLGVIRGEKEQKYGFDQDRKLLKLIDHIEGLD